MIWAGADASEELNQLAEQVRSSLSEAAIPFDPKPFFPHITLGRKPVIPPGFNISEMIVPQVVMTVKDVFLYRSDRDKTGMVYSVIGCGSGQRDKMR